MTAQQPEPRPSIWAQATAPLPELAHALKVRRYSVGIILGAALGLSYGLVSQLINRLALPGVPLHQPPLGPFGNTLLNILVGAGLGFLTTRPDSAAPGIFMGSIASAAAIVVNTLLRLGGIVDASTAFITGLVISAPIAWLTVPVIALLRWTVDRQVDAFRSGAPLLARLRTPIALVLVMGALASFELLPGTARAQLTHTHTLLQAGLASAPDSPASLPAPLRGPWMRDFPPAGDRNYALEWTEYDLDRFIELRPPSSYDQHAAVIAHFDNGVTVVCLYPTPKGEPNCGNY